MESSVVHSSPTSHHAQGKHPFVYALAEFVDNSLRATSRASEPRNITISFVLNSSSLSSAKGLVCIQDTGCGMTKRDLNDWVRRRSNGLLHMTMQCFASSMRKVKRGYLTKDHAHSRSPLPQRLLPQVQAVMNYSMEERGQLSQPSISASPTKYLNSNISYFGVSWMQMDWVWLSCIMP